MSNTATLVLVGNLTDNPAEVTKAAKASSDGDGKAGDYWTIIGYIPVLYLLVWPLTWHAQLTRQIDDLDDKLEELRQAEDAHER